MTGQDILKIMVIGTTALCVLTVVITQIVIIIQEKLYKNWANKCYEEHPELKTLLFDYHQKTEEHRDTCNYKKELQKLIDDCEEKNKYYPIGKKLDKHINELKENFYETLELYEQTKQEQEEARQALVAFWEANFPNLPEEKRIMWR